MKETQLLLIMVQSYSNGVTKFRNRIDTHECLENSRYELTKHKLQPQTLK